MRISIIGAGNAGCAVAADLAYRGHDVTLIKTSYSIHDDNFDYLVENNGLITIDEFGVIKTARIKHVTRDISKVTNSDVILIQVQTNYHECLLERLSSYLKDGQILLVIPGYLSTAYVLKHCTANVIVAEAESSFIDCRICSPGHIKVGFRNVRNPIGIFPVDKKEEAKHVLDKLGFPLVYLDSVVEAALHNPNMIVHTVGAIMSIPRIEKNNGEYCMYHEVWTPSVWNILENLDAEKMDVLEHLGLPRIAYVDACKYRNSLDDQRDGKEVFMWYAAMPTRAKGPLKVDSRYISEDVPQGLVMLESLGKILHVDTPITTSLIELATAALGRSMREKGRSLEKLGLENVKRVLSNHRL